MRFFEWIIALVVAVIAWHWLRGKRPGRAVALAGAVAVLCSVVVEGQRTVMWPAYLVVAIALILSFRGPAAPPRAGVLRIAGRGLLVLIVLVAGVALPWLWPVIKLPKPTGPHRIGTTWLVVRDTSRAERFTSDANARREFPVQVWYPTTADAKGKRARYASAEEMSFAGMIPALLAKQVELVRTHAIQDAPVAEGRAPVLIFSHGYSGYIAQNTPQVEELVSRGYIVASIGHTGESAAAPFPDGRVILMDTTVMANLRRQMESQLDTDAEAQQRMMDSISATLSVADPVQRQANFRKFIEGTAEPLRSESVREWALDTKALVDLLEQLNAGTVQSPLRGRLDLDRLGVFGMSYGGATAGEFCAEDSRCKVAINIDGGQYGRLVDDSLMVPLLIIGSSQAYGAHVPVLDLTRGPAWLIRVPETNHIGLTDLSLQGPLFRWMGVVGKLDPDRREAIMTDYTVGFFEKYLMQRAEQFDGLAAKFPEVQVTTRNVN